MKRISVVLVITGLLFASVPGWAHHSFQAEYDQSKPLTLVGKLTKVVEENAHGWIYLDAKNDRGQSRQLGAEIPAPNVVVRNGFDGSIVSRRSSIMGNR